ncbi:MAG: hypothetical protein HYX52_05600 [Chloroflexi bacterium]|nr:hypothetical protein [Chloroflexota bacterium]
MATTILDSFQVVDPPPTFNVGDYIVHPINALGSFDSSYCVAAIRRDSSGEFMDLAHPTSAPGVIAYSNIQVHRDKWTRWRGYENPSPLPVGATYILHSWGLLPTPVLVIGGSAFASRAHVRLAGGQRSDIPLSDLEPWTADLAAKCGTKLPLAGVALKALMSKLKQDQFSVQRQWLGTIGKVDTHGLRHQVYATELVCHECLSDIPLGMVLNTCPVRVAAVKAKRQLQLQAHAWDFDSNTCRQCGYAYEKISTLPCPASRYGMPLTAPPRSQKAMGVAALQRSELLTPPSCLIRTRRQAEYAWSIMASTGQAFARPCPVRPRHGFVDSRPVYNLAELLGVMKETRRADPEGEVLLMPTIAATHSAIWRPGLLVGGASNDGATSGKDSFSFPLVERGVPYDLRRLVERSNIGDGNVPYIETVIEQKGTGDKAQYTPWFVQVRGGPEVRGTAPDYVPETTRVTRVVEAQGDLLEWEALARTFDKGTVVYHPGGSLASHYAVHCVLNKVPILITEKPEIGALLEPRGDDRMPLNANAVARGIAAGTAYQLPRKKSHNVVAAVVLALHNVNAMEGDDGFWIGAAAALMQRLGAAAALGELRHRRKKMGTDRDFVYDKAFLDPFRARRGLSGALYGFLHWNWTRAFGGMAWANCTQATINLDNAIRDVVRDGSETSVAELVGRLNTCVNMAHNSGWWLNKYTTTLVMEQAADGHPQAAIDAVPVLFDLLHVDAGRSLQARAAWERTAPHRTLVAKAKVPRVLAEPVAQGHFDGKNSLHVQYKDSPDAKVYATLDLLVPTPCDADCDDEHCENWVSNELAAAVQQSPSWAADSGTKYQPLNLTYGRHGTRVSVLTLYGNFIGFLP